MAPCVFQRWLKCLFKREFPIKSVCLIWDTILANEGENPTGELEYVDYFVIAMLLNIKDTLLKRDNNEMFEVLLHYPEVNRFNEFLKLAEKVKDNLAIPNNSEDNNIEFSSSSKEQPKVNSNIEQVKLEVGSQSTKTIMQINPLLFNPQLMMNPNMKIMTNN